MSAPSRHRRKFLLLGLAAGALLALVAFLAFGRRANPREVVLDRRLIGLERLLATPQPGSLADFDRAMVIVDQRLVQNLLTAAIPYEGSIAGLLKIALTSAEVSFEDGTALARLDGTAWMRGGKQDDPLAKVHVYAELDVVDLDPKLGVLRTSLHVIAVDAGQVNVPLVGPFLTRVVERLGRIKIESFEGLRYQLEIPIRLGNELRLPELGPEGEVRIAPATIALTATVQDVKAFRGKLWVAVDVGVAAGADAAGDSSAAESVATPRGAGGDRPGDRSSTAAARVVPAARPAGVLTEGYRSALHDSLETRIAADRYVALALADSAEIALALREAVITDILSEAARRYLDRVELEIDPRNVRVHKEGDLRVTTRVGKINAGRWKVYLAFQKLHGVLRAKRPKVTVTGPNRVHVEIPTLIESGTGAASLRFIWDPAGVANLVCHSFETTQAIEGRIVPREYVLSGDFVLSARSESIVADPEFPADKFPVCVEPSPETWRRVMAALEAQDDWAKCGMAMDPAEAAKRLAGICEEGFNVKLPQRIFRTAVVPASLVKSVRVGQSRVELSIRPNALRVSPGAFWFSASFETEIKSVEPDTGTEPDSAR